MIYLEPVESKKNFKNDIIEPKIVILYGPSGAGKTLWKDFLDGELKVNQIIKIVETYHRNLWKDIGSEILNSTNVFIRHFEPFNKIITMTTRPQRHYEKNMIHYRFLTEEEFSKERELGNVLEETKNFGYHYGSNKQDIEYAFRSKNAVIVLDNKGVKKFKELYGNRVIAIYTKIDPIEMEKRMIARGESEDNIVRRLNSIQDENHIEAGLSDYVLNSMDRIDIVMHNLLNILLKECLMRKDIKYVIQRKTACIPEIDDIGNIPSRIVS